MEQLSRDHSTNHVAIVDKLTQLQSQLVQKGNPARFALCASHDALGGLRRSFRQRFIGSGFEFGGQRGFVKSVPPITAEQRYDRRGYREERNMGEYGRI